METLEAIAKILSIVATIFLGGKWIINRIESGQQAILNEQRKLLKKIRKKVSHSECAELRKNCACAFANNNKGVK
jgi:hypothetical protein